MVFTYGENHIPDLHVKYEFSYLIDICTYYLLRKLFFLCIGIKIFYNIFKTDLIYFCFRINKLIKVTYSSQIIIDEVLEEFRTVASSDDPTLTI